MLQILIVEDEFIVAESLEYELKTLDYQVAAIVKSGEEALQIVRERPIDLILMDIHLHGKLDGVETAERIRATHNIPIVYITAFSNEQILQRAKITEPFGYLLKPFHTSELRSNIEMAIYKHRMEKALKESEERYRRITNAVTDYIYTVLIRPDRSIETTHSAACVAVTGYTSQEFMHKPYLWFEMVYPEDRIEVQQLTTIILDEKTVPSPLEHRIIRKDGMLRWIKNTLVPHYDAQGKLLSYDGLIRDITERKQAQEDLEAEHALLAQNVEERTTELRQANKELARTARLKDEFLANMSHELRTPLNTILGLSEVMDQEIYGPLNTKQLDAIRHIDESATHLLDLITDILDLSKIGAGKFELYSDTVEVYALVQSSLRFVKQIALKKKIHIQQQLDPNAVTLYADARRVKQILVNLLSNAVKFTPEGGTIGLDVQSDPIHHVIHFCVWDTGIGIAQKDMPYLFQPFVQLNGTLARTHTGTGLGLTLVTRMVDLHGGSISVESTVGEGSRFTVSLPWHTGMEEPPDQKSQASAAAGDTSSHQPSASSAASARQANILIADDHETSIAPLAEYLMALGYHVQLVHDGAQAVRQVQQKHPDVIVLDIQMPEMDGLEAIRQIRAHQATRCIPIIALTALAMPGDREMCLKAGANDYLSKPVSLRMIHAVIQRFLTEEIS